MKLKIATLSFELSHTGNRIQLLPAGHFRATDGRPFECDGWFIDADIAASVIARAAGKTNDLAIDYEHQTLKSAKNGQPAPASGWFKQMEWDDETGLFATDVRWTENAATMIAAKEYRYISAVFLYDKNGRVIEVLHAALTNTPALDGMDEVMLAAASYLVSLSTTHTENSQMEDFLQNLRWMLNLPITSTAEEVIAELQKVIDRLSGGVGTAAASVNLLQILTDNDQQIATLSASVASLSAFNTNNMVPLEQLIALQHQVAALTAERQAEKLDETIMAALSDGRLMPAQKDWASQLGKTNPALLTTYLESAQPIAALGRTQTLGNEPPLPEDKTHGLDAETLAVCSIMGTDPSEVAANLKEEN
ncbi:phage protease [Limnobaculum xujianqingii]|uniref:phage protease n=1 Tax=Limnobaculum xujianqingii TaxID=2738837 RepID=UPI00112651AE|nr:phage protease [Limnobaculum xujianqingii]